MRRLLLTLFIFLAVTTRVRAEIMTEEIKYESDGVELTGFVAWDDSLQEKRPGIIIVHEWWGHNDYVRNRAKMLAELGYVALAIDMYGTGKVADHPDNAKAFMQEATQNMDVARARFLAGVEILKSSSKVDGSRIGAIGYCFGGATVLNMARWGADLKGVVSFHGSLGSTVQAAPGDIKAKILVCHGGADSFIPPDAVAAFKQEMDEAKANYQFISYPGAKHSFTNPDADTYAEKFGMDVAYNKEADEQSWKDMQAFFKSIF